MINDILGAAGNDLPPDVIMMMLNENGLGQGNNGGGNDEYMFQDDLDQAIIQSIFE